MESKFQLCSLYHIVTEKFSQAISLAYPTFQPFSPSIAVANPFFGDYQCNSALTLYKTHKNVMEKETTVESVAQTIADKLDKSCFAQVNVAKQGFITVQFASQYLEELLPQAVPCLKRYGESSGLRCLVDYSSPNIAKEMHVGHLRSSILGESLARIFEFCGYQVSRINHLGDWGTQFGMLIEHLKETCPNFQDNPPSLENLTVFYKEAKLRFDTDPQFKRLAQRNVPLLQGGDPTAVSAWKLLCEISRANFQLIYNCLNIKLTERGESFYNDMIPSVYQEIQDKGYITDCSGAKCFFVPNDPVPLFVVKSDGGYGYDSTDLAAIKHRLCVEKNDLVLYVTDIGQENHFHKIFKAAMEMGWYDPKKHLCAHVGFGLVQGEDGKKFKTRSGDTVKLIDLMDEAVKRCRKELEERYASQNDLEERQTFFADPQVLNASAKSIGYSAIRYFDLKQNRMSNYKFSYAKMLDPKDSQWLRNLFYLGNTAVYLLYAYARICSIFRKKKIDVDDVIKQNISLVEPEERALAISILRFYEIILAISQDYFVHRLADYVHTLSTTFTTFYQKCKIISSDYEASRLHLCEMTRRYLEMAFYLLGIEPIESI